MAISWWDCQDHFPEPTCRASVRRAEGRNDGLARAVFRDGLADRSACVVVPAQATPAMENRQRATGILVYLHRRPDKVWTQRALREL
jgi:hypothetical protein